MRVRNLVLYWLMALLPLLIVLALLPGIPDRVAMQYRLSGEISRYGSKYELLILPGMALFISAILYRIGAESQKRSERGRQNQKIIIACGQIISCCFGVLSVVMTYYAGTLPTNIEQTHAYRIVAFVMSLMFVLMGNLLPKCKRGERYWMRVGLRTPWTLRDDEVWNKTNRIGGYCMVAVGLLGAVLSFLLPGMWSLMAVIALLLAVMAFSTLYSWKLYRELHGRG